MKNKPILVSAILVLFSIQVYCQDLAYAQKTVKKLSSKKFFGRGYTKNGDQKAAFYIQSEFKKLGIKPVNNNYFQEYFFSVNTYPGKTKMSIDGKNLIPGKEFCLRPFSPGINGTFDIVMLDTNLFRTAITEEQKNNLANKIGIYDTTGWGNKWFQYFFRSKSQLPYKGTIQIIEGTPGFSASTRTGKQAMMMVTRNAFPENAKRIEIDIEAKTVNHRALNVIGILPGETDSLIVFTAHYDHLGGFGNKAFFPGANDNASGTAMVLDFAREYSKQSKHKYSYAFMLFSGEEAGLLGSYNYTANPTIPLEKIKMLFNLDMVGTGIDGVSVFNGNTHPKEFALLDSLNKVNSFDLKLSSKGISANSDIYPFYKKGVKGFFLLTNDKKAPYHTVTDTYDKLGFQSYEKLVKLIMAYINTL